MPSYTTSLRLIQPATGEYSGTWGTQVNNGITALVDASVAGTASITMTAANYTLSTANGASDEARSMFLVLGGTPGGSYQVIVPAVSKLYFVTNGTGFAQTVKTSAGSGISVPNGARMTLRCDGTDVVVAQNYFASLTLGAALPITSGGTGSTSTTYCSLTTNVTGTLPVGNGGTGATTLTGVVKGNGASAFTAGTVSLTTEVSGTLPVANGGTGNTTIPARSIFLANALNTLTTLTPGAGQSIRINAGNTAWETFTPATGNVVLASNNAFTGANTFYNATGQTFGTGTAAQDGIIIAGRAGGASTYRVTLSPGTLTANRAITLPNAAGEIVLDTATQTLTNKTLTSPTLTTPALGTPASGVLTNCTGTAVGLTAGNLTQTTVGTAVNVTTATDPGGSTAGNINITAGSSSSGTAGNVIISAGLSSTGTLAEQGDITIQAYGTLLMKGQGSSSDVQITTVASGGASNSTNITIQTGFASSTGNSGDLKIGVGSVASGTRGKIDFLNCDVANGAVATTITSLGPTGSSTTIQGWLAVKINGVARYIPFW